MTTSLLYHDVAAAGAADEAGFPGAVAARYKLTPEHFEEHLDALHAAGLEVVALSDDRAAADGSCALTFDDGGASAMLAADALERRGWRGHFFVTTGRIGTEGFLGEREIRELARRGHVIGGHSHSHPGYMGRLGSAEIEAEWVRCRAVLGEVLGEPPRMASLPGGYLTRSVITGAGAAGFSALMTSEPVKRARVLDGVVVRGRFTMWSTTPARQAVAYARGERLACARLRAEWAAKKAVKRVVSPRLYEPLRRARAGPGTSAGP